MSATRDRYDVRSDVWSLGITLVKIKLILFWKIFLLIVWNCYRIFSISWMEIRLWTTATNRWRSTIKIRNRSSFRQLQRLCKYLVNPSHYLILISFVLVSLNKNENERPKYKQLLEHPFLQRAKDDQQIENALAYLSHIIDGLEKNTDKFQLYYYLPSNWRSDQSIDRKTKSI